MTLIITFCYRIFSNLMTDPNLADCRKEADVVFVVDSTSNLLYRDFRKYILGTIVDIIRRLTVDSGRTRVAAVQFTNTAKVRLRRVSSVTKAVVGRAQVYYTTSWVSKLVTVDL